MNKYYKSLLKSLTSQFGDSDSYLVKTEVTESNVILHFCAEDMPNAAEGEFEHDRNIYQYTMMKKLNCSHPSDAQNDMIACMYIVDKVYLETIAEVMFINIMSFNEQANILIKNVSVYVSNQQVVNTITVETLSGADAYKTFDELKESSSLKWAAPRVEGEYHKTVTKHSTSFSSKRNLVTYDFRRTSS